MRTVIPAGIALVALLCAPAALGKRRDRGTHFVTELSAGSAFGTGFPEGGAGYALRTTFGYGGAFKGFPPRFYLITALRWGSLFADVTERTQRSDIQRDLLDVSAGLRVLVPIRRFRILSEVTLGSSSVWSSARINGGLERYESADSRFAVYLAVGAQYRLHRNLSLGLLAEWSLPTERAGLDVVAEASRLRDDGGMHGWTALTATVVGHF